MSAGSSGETITVVLQGPDGASPCSPGTQQPGQPGPGGSGNAQSPSGFRSVSQQNRRDAREAVFGQYLGRIPGMPIATARDLAAGARIGIAAEQRGARAGAAVRLAQAQFGAAGGAGARFGGVAAGTLGGGMLVGGATALAAAFAGLGLAVVGATRLYRMHGQALQQALGGVRGTGVLEGLQARQEAELRLAREMRALQRAPQLAEMVEAQTRRQMAFDELSTSFGLFMERGLRPLADSAADLASLIAFASDVVSNPPPALQALGQISQAFDISMTTQTMKLLRRFLRDSADKIREDKKIGQDELNRMYQHALSPFRGDALPYQAGTPEANLVNPIT